MISFPFNYWYIGCASSRLRLAPTACSVLGRDFVLFRDAAGSPHALLDRCSHRGAKLSLGRANDGTIACPYHGWRYDGSGRCVLIPSLTSERHIPEGIEVPSFPCVERDGYVWIWTGDSGLEPLPLLGIPDFGVYRWRQGCVPMQCNWMKGIENNLDWCHPYFTHRWTHGQFFATYFGGFREQSYEVRLTDHGMIVFAPVTANEEDSLPARPLVKLNFQLPDQVRVEFWRPFHLIVLMHFVPTGSGSCRLEWLTTKLIQVGRRVVWTDREPKIFKQDRVVMESSQPWYNREGSAFERSVEADASTLMARRIVELAAEGRWEEKRSSLPRRRVVTVRA